MYCRPHHDRRVSWWCWPSACRPWHHPVSFYLFTVHTVVWTYEFEKCILEMAPRDLTCVNLPCFSQISIKLLGLSCCAVCWSWTLFRLLQRSCQTWHHSVIILNECMCSFLILCVSRSSWSQKPSNELNYVQQILFLSLNTLVVQWFCLSNKGVCPSVPGVVVSRLGRRGRIAGTPGNRGKLKFIHSTIHIHLHTYCMNISNLYDMDW